MKYDQRGWIKDRKVILCDGDGVLCNWCGAVESYRHLLFNTKPNASLQEIYDKCKLSELFDFWSNMEWMPRGRELYDFCRVLAPTYICSAPSEHPNSAAGKVAWFNRELKHGDFILAMPKWAIASPNHLLIDDNKKKCDRFVLAGGNAIRYDEANLDNVKLQIAAWCRGYD